MSLDVYLMEDGESVYESNITHNLNKMAIEAGIYESLWRPYLVIQLDHVENKDHSKEIEFEESCNIVSDHIVNNIEVGLKDLKDRPDHYKQFNSPNGWGKYKDFVPFVENYLKALKEYPKVKVWR